MNRYFALENVPQEGVQEGAQVLHGRNHPVLMLALALDIATAIIYFSVPGDSDYINSEKLNKAAKYTVVGTIFCGVVAAQVFLLREKRYFFRLRTIQSFILFGVVSAYMIATISFALWVKNSYESSDRIKWGGFFTSAICLTVSVAILIAEIMADFEDWRNQFQQLFRPLHVRLNGDLPIQELEEAPINLHLQLSAAGGNADEIQRIVTEHLTPFRPRRERFSNIIHFTLAWLVVVTVASYFYLWYEGQSVYPGATVIFQLGMANLTVLALVIPIAQFNSTWEKIQDRYNFDANLTVKVGTIAVNEGILYFVAANLVYYIYAVIIATAKNYEKKE